jgi:hypothetical protein
MAAGAKLTMKLISALVGIPVGIFSKKLVQQTWIAARPEDPPRAPGDKGVKWADAIGWAALSAGGLVLAELITQRTSEVAYKAITGSEPPPPDPTKAEKKAAKKAAKAEASA